MIASIWCDYFENLSPENAVLTIRDTGFCCGDFGLDHSQALLARSADVEKTGLEFHRFMADVGFSTPQGHLDFLKDLTLPETVEALKKRDHAVSGDRCQKCCTPHQRRLGTA